MKKHFFSKCLTFVSVFALALTLMFSYGKSFSDVNVTKAQACSVQNIVAEGTGEPVTPTPPTNLGGAVANDSSSNGIDDIYLYQYLLKAYNDYYALTGTENEAKQIYVEMFSEMTELDLSNANGLIKNVKGLNVLNLENVKVLNLSRNQISSIDPEDIKNLRSLEELILYDNNLKSLTLPTSLLNLKKLNLNKNYLSSIDISFINIGEVYLSFNKFTSINDITMPRIIYNTDLYVELFNNNILDADAAYTEGISAGGKIKLELGLQGYGLNYKTYDANEDKVTPVFSKNNKLKFYNSTKYPNLKVQIFKRYQNEQSVLEVVNGTNVITEHSLPVGEYRVEYVDSTTGLTMHVEADPYFGAFKQHDGFKVVPTAPVVKFVVKGEEVEERNKFTGVGTLKATSPDNEGDIYYSFDGINWVKGNEVKLDNGGQYGVSFKVVIGELGAVDSFESEVVTKQVSQSINPYIPDTVMLILIVGLILLFVFVAIPLLSKYVINR